jgi:hypothetical protein
MRPRIYPIELWLSQIDTQDCMCFDREMNADSKTYCYVRLYLKINVLLNINHTKFVFLFQAASDNMIMAWLIYTSTET